MRYPVLRSQEEAIGITGPSPALVAEAEPAPAQPAGPPLVLREGVPNRLRLKACASILT
jgi:hypothetical protein